VLGARGASRCIAASGYLRVLAARGDSAAIAEAWRTLEVPLLEALPDCPPGTKPELARALEGCASVCANRATAQSLMVMRNGIGG
jgi:hypothetical protein